MNYKFMFFFCINLPVSTLGILESKLDDNVRIVGGKNVSISTIPYQVSIRGSGNNHFCGGAIIDQFNVLTAAHCFDRHKKDKLFCAIDATTLNDGNLYAVKSATVYPGYDSEKIINDIAILHMAEGMYINNKTAKAITLAIRTPSVDSNCTVSGWGSEVPPIRPDMALPSFYLRAATVPIFSMKKCVKNYLHNLNVTLSEEGILCAGFVDGKQDSCQGDSGGPLVCNGKLSGIISWGFGCALPDIPGIYTDVAQFRTWVLNNLSENSSSIVNSSLLKTIIVSFLLILINF